MRSDDFLAYDDHARVHASDSSKSTKFSPVESTICDMVKLCKSCTEGACGSARAGNPFDKGPACATRKRQLFVEGWLVKGIQKQYPGNKRSILFPRGCWKIVQMPHEGLGDQAITLFCSSCKSVFLPGTNCTIRTLTKLRKKHEFRKKKMSRKGKRGSCNKYINKGLVYTCKLCGNREIVGIAAPTQTRGEENTKIDKKK